MMIKRLNYTWTSTLFFVLLVFYLYLNGNRDIAYFYQLPELLFIWHAQLVAIAVVLVIVCIEIRLFYGRQKKLALDINDLHSQLEELKLSKKQLQTKAHTYSGQADKLKLFISDRLLEYIEYDEKFLHFRGIAAEVRHNGIICYDKVLTALNSAIARNDEDHDNYSEALTSLNYLWDLLDLSTADNIALHINNHLCECEEYYYQQQLQNTSSDISPYTPTFYAHNALLRAIHPLMTETNNKTLAVLADQMIQCNTDNQFHFTLDNECELLGNENHLVLVMENLIKNALFYSNKTKPGINHSKKYHRIAISLSRHDSTAKLSIYNHGPHIDADHQQQIFQLGFTTRRAKNEQGRGLGLYFVKEIVNGYEGKLLQKNITNKADSYSIRIKLNSGSFEGPEIITTIVNVALQDDTLYCSNGTKTATENHSGLELVAGKDVNELPKAVEWKYDKLLSSIEITPRSTGTTHAFTDFPAGESFNIADPGNPKIPRWAIEVQSKKRSCKITFVPVDITGVEFSVSLPCAGSQFDYQQDEIQMASDAYLNSVSSKFKTLDL